MNNKSLEERTIYDGPKNNERVNVTRALERLYGCILNKKKDKMKFFVRYEKKSTFKNISGFSPHYDVDLFIYKENFKGMFAHVEISMTRMDRLKKIGCDTMTRTETRKSYRYGKVMWDGYLDMNSMQSYFSEVTIKDVDFTLKRGPLETNAEIKVRKGKERLEELRQREKENMRAFFEISSGINHWRQKY